MTSKQKRKSVFLKVRFRNEDAAYYQFYVFPVVDSRFEICLARKRNADCQYLEIYYYKASELRDFTAELRHNPHVVEVVKSNRAEFVSKHSDAV